MHDSRILAGLEPMIRVEGFRAARAGRTVIEDVTFDAQPGEVLVLTGGSGAETGSLFRHLIGLDTPAAGRILIDGEEMTAADAAGRSRIRRKIGVAFRGGALLEYLTVLENVRLPLEVHTNLDADMANMVALTKLRLVDMEHAARRLPLELTPAMHVRCAIARGLALDPVILFVDLQSADIDPIESAELDELILSLNRTFDLTFVVITNDLPSIFRIAHRVIVLDARAKTMVAWDEPARLRDASPSPRVRAFFNRLPAGVAT